MDKPKVIVITGPTASGKSALAVEVAKYLNTEIISADSRQIFKGIPIVTATPTEEEKGGITHHLLEMLPLDAYYSAAEFKNDADNLIRAILRKNNAVVVCGGSMLYIDALTKGIDELPTVPNEIRLPLMKKWADSGDEWLINQLRTLDPQYFEKADKRNLKRVFHAVEISITAGKPYSSLLTGTGTINSDTLPYNIIKVCLNGSRASLFDRINARVLNMMDAGLEEEASRVYPLRRLNSLNTVGLKEMFAFFDGIFTKDEAVARIQKNTRVYAKKQITWHKRDNALHYLDFETPLKINRDNIISLLK